MGLSDPRTSVRTVSAQLSLDLAGDGTELNINGRDVGHDASLRNTTFVIVDLETTGSRPGDDRITEIGAVKVRGGQMLGEFATLVDPGREIPPQIVRLTGISTAMVYDAPPIAQVLPAFLEFARGSVLVAHNARFDMGFLRAAALELGHPWAFGPALCTVKLARRVLTREEAPTVRLSALSTLFGTTATPCHRALDDARATVEVMHALFERIGNLGVQTHGELREYLPGVPREVRAKRTFADGLPDSPGVYLFRGPSDEVLYIGTAINLRRRVRGYFTGSETRGRMREMVRLATRVDHVECSHGLEAGVRELRLLGAHAPPYNRKSKYPHRGWWVNLTDETFPRLSVGRTPTPDAVGPIRQRAMAYDIADLLAQSCGIRSCRTRLGSMSTHECRTDADGRVPVGGCHGATSTGIDATAYRPRAARAQALLQGADDAPLRTLLNRLDHLAAQQLFENAARLRDRLTATVEALDRCQRLTALARIGELVAASPDGRGGWELAVIRHGRLAGAGVAVRGVPPMPVVQSLVAAAETVLPGDGPLRGAAHEEVALVYRWLLRDDVRIVCATGGFMLPVAGATRWVDWREQARAARSDGLYPGGGRDDARMRPGSPDDGAIRSDRLGLSA